MITFFNLVTLAIYFDCLIFVVTTAIVQYGLNANENEKVCRLAIWFCLIFYLTSKLMLYIFFTERVYLVQDCMIRRHENKLYISTVIVVIGGYTVIIILQFIFRISHITPNGFCIIGMQRKVILPLIGYEVLMNLYLLSVFLWPLRQLYSNQVKENANIRQMAKCSLIGTVIILLASGANLIAIAILNGEKSWICLLFCNLDILISSLVLHWLTNSNDKGRRNAIHIHQQTVRW